MSQTLTRFDSSSIYRFFSSLHFSILFRSYSIFQLFLDFYCASFFFLSQDAKHREEMVNPNCSNDLDRKKYRYKNIDYDILIGINVETFVFSFFIRFPADFWPFVPSFLRNRNHREEHLFRQTFLSSPFLSRKSSRVFKN